MTAQGHPHRIFATAIERGNIVMAEATARELGRISLEEALALTALVTEKEPERRSRFAVRWLRRLLEEHKRLTVEEAAIAASCLSALGGPSHEEAYGMLAAMADRATRQMDSVEVGARPLGHRRRFAANYLTGLGPV